MDLALLPLMNNKPTNIDFLIGGGEMGARIRAYDWNSSVLGAPESWPQSLRVTVRLILNSRQPMLIWWGPELIQLYNDAYIPLMETGRHPSALGGRCRDYCADIWDMIEPQTEYIIAGKGPIWEEDRLVPVFRDGRRENAWWSYSWAPIDIEGGGVGGVLVICNDVTPQHLSNKALKDETRHLTMLFERAPSYMAVLRGPNHVFELTNTAYGELFGERDFIGKPLCEAMPEMVPQGALELLDKVYRSGKAYVGKRVPLMVLPLIGEPSKNIFMDFVFQPIIEADGATSGIFVAGVDVTDHVHAEQHLQLMNAELEHRIKNMLAVVTATVSQTLRDVLPRAALDTLRSRLAALGRCYEFQAAKNLADVPIRNVIESALMPLVVVHDRISISGPNIRIAAKQALSMGLAIHELTTNAIKYGALSDDKGRITIVWREEIDDGLPIFDFLWKESGGPPIVAPSAKGFGSELVEGQLAWAFGGHVEVRYDPDGFSCHVTAPMKNLDNPRQ